MALFDDLFKGDTAKGLAIGLGAAVVAPVALAALGGVARPLARAGIKAGIILYEKGRETLAEFGEVMDDLVAEARSEVAQSRAAQHAGEAVEQAAEAVSEAAAETPPPKE